MEKRMDSIDLTPKQHSEVKALLKRHLPNVEVWAYGSRVTFKTRHNSDLDLVAFADKERRSALHNLREAFEESYLPFSVDVLAWDDIPDRFKPNIRRAYYVLQEREASDKKLTTLADFAELNPKVEIRKGEPYPFLEMKDIDPHARYISTTKMKRHKGSGSKFMPGDTLFARITPCLENGKISQYIGAPNVPAWGSTEFIVLRGKEGISDADFVYYFSRSPEFRDFAIKQMEGASGRQRVTHSALAKFRYELPSLKKQKAIAHILGMLDDKIEGNQKINKEMEEIAKTIFQSWFVDFVPVRAKMEGRPTGLSPDVSALFPEKLTQSKIGKIPHGWELLPGQTLYEPREGLSYKGKFLSENPDDIPMLSLGSFAGGGGYRKEKLKFYNGEHKEWHKIRPDDLLIANTDLTQDRVIIGSPIIVPQSPNKSEYYLHTHHTTKITPKSGSPVSKVYLYYNFLQPAFRGRAAGFAIGTTVLALPKDTFESLLILVPPKPLLEKFEAIAQPIVKRLSRSSQEEDVLIELRDTLLPMLISGELQIKNVKKIIEQTGI